MQMAALIRNSLQWCLASILIRKLLDLKISSRDLLYSIVAIANNIVLYMKFAKGWDLTKKMIIKVTRENSGDDEYAYGLDDGDGFTGV